MRAVPFSAAVSALAAALVLAGTAGAADPPAAYGDARKGSLVVVSGVVLLPKGGELKGVWLDETRSCLAKRTLKVTIDVSYTSPSGVPKRLKTSKSGAVTNCAEGGPNFGFDLTAQAAGVACPSGAWKPGRYGFLTRTRDLASGLEASASLLWHKTGSC